MKNKKKIQAPNIGKIWSDYAQNVFGLFDSKLPSDCRDSYVVKPGTWFRFFEVKNEILHKDQNQRNITVNLHSEYPSVLEVCFDPGRYGEGQKEESILVSVEELANDLFFKEIENYLRDGKIPTGLLEKAFMQRTYNRPEEDQHKVVVIRRKGPSELVNFEW